MSNITHILNSNWCRLLLGEVTRLPLKITLFSELLSWEKLCKHFETLSLINSSSFVPSCKFGKCSTLRSLFVCVLDVRVHLNVDCGSEMWSLRMLKPGLNRFMVWDLVYYLCIISKLMRFLTFSFSPSLPKYTRCLAWSACSFARSLSLLRCTISDPGWAVRSTTGVHESSERAQQAHWRSGQIHTRPGGSPKHITLWFTPWLGWLTPGTTWQTAALRRWCAASDEPTQTIESRCNWK